MRFASWMSVGVLLTAVACTNAPTQVLVRVEAEDEARADATRLQFVARTSPPVTPFEITFRLRDEVELPTTIPLEPVGGEVGRPFDIQVSLLNAASVATHTIVARGRFASGRHHLFLRFEESCRSLLCSNRQTCFGGICTDACVTPQRDEPSQPTPFEACDGPSDAGVDAGCGDEICNGIDDDCDMRIDEGVGELPTVCVGFGRTTEGPGWVGNGADRLRVSQFVAGSSLSASAIYMRLRPNEDAEPADRIQVHRAVLYAERDGGPGELIATGPEMRIELDRPTWVRLPLEPSVALGGGAYWVGHWSGENSQGTEHAGQVLEDFTTCIATADYGAAAAPPGDLGGCPERSAPIERIQRQIPVFVERLP